MKTNNDPSVSQISFKVYYMPEVFTKDLSNYTPYQVELIFEKSYHLYTLSKSVHELLIPEPVSYNQRQIVFKWVPMSATWVNELKMGRSWDPSLFNTAGMLLGILHSANNDLNKPIILLSDFVPANICITENQFIFFDFEPPPRMESFFDLYNTNYNYLDLAAFIFATWTPHPLERFYRFFSDHGLYCNEFLKGYASATGFNISLQQLKSFLELIYSGYRYRMLHGEQASTKRVVKLAIIDSFIDTHFAEIRSPRANLQSINRL